MINMKPLSLAAKESNWRLYMTRKADSAFLSFQEKVFQRDQFSCQFCGFCSEDAMEVVNLDHNYLNNKISNCATSCPLCAQCCFIDAIGKSDFGGGVLIYMPELSQGELNALCHMLFFNIVTGSALVSRSKDIYRGLKMRTQPLEKIIGKGLSNPSVYGQVLIDSNREDADELHQIIVDKVRLLPNFKRFSPHVLSWSQKGIDLLYEH